MKAAVRRVVLALALPVVLLALWAVVSDGSKSFYLPPLSRILATFGPTWIPRFTSDVLPSVIRLLIGYAGTVVLGVGSGVALGSLPRLRAMVEPVLEFFRALPPPALVPIFMLLFGVGTPMRLLVIVSGAIWPVLLNTVEGIRAIDEVLADTCKVYGITGATRLRLLVVRGASP
jgi:ABC-type nitrate/sulfonate/bicarbonate transport system permease component